ncbi:GpE family phage tail protein [Altererythrobacter sp. CC-YST694]|uniref:GpE family phage tail protein n=1 Tax=Altererythrobacter sp. CC-YST694 TaxID=2755038 RepID=UPI0039AEC9E2
MRRCSHRFFSDPGRPPASGGSVEELIADIALIFHWPPAVLLEMELAELRMWRELAVSRWNDINRVAE